MIYKGGGGWGCWGRCRLRTDPFCVCCTINETYTITRKEDKIKYPFQLGCSLEKTEPPIVGMCSIFYISIHVDIVKMLLHIFSLKAARFSDTDCSVGLSQSMALLSSYSQNLPPDV